MSLTFIYIKYISNEWLPINFIGVNNIFPLFLTKEHKYEEFIMIVIANGQYRYLANILKFGISKLVYKIMEMIIWRRKLINISLFDIVFLS